MLIGFIVTSMIKIIAILELLGKLTAYRAGDKAYLAPY
jgi:hypothetical protein